MTLALVNGGGGGHNDADDSDDDYDSNDDNSDELMMLMIALICCQSFVYKMTLITSDTSVNDMMMILVLNKMAIMLMIALMRQSVMITLDYHFSKTSFKGDDHS